MTAAIPEQTERDADLMARYGITRVPADRFHFKSYRYSTLAEAVAQAKRERAGQGADMV